MTDAPIEIIQFTDIESGDEALVVVRTTDQAIGLTLSLRHNGDIEVLLSRSDAIRLVEALRQALGEAR